MDHPNEEVKIPAVVAKAATQPAGNALNPPVRTKSLVPSSTVDTNSSSQAKTRSERTDETSQADAAPGRVRISSANSKFPPNQREKFSVEMYYNGEAPLNLFKGCPTSITLGVSITNVPAGTVVVVSPSTVLSKNNISMATCPVFLGETADAIRVTVSNTGDATFHLIPGMSIATMTTLKHGASIQCT